MMKYEIRSDVCRVIMLTAATATSLASTAAGQTFQGIGDLPGGAFDSFARSVSIDGVVVGGSMSDQGSEAFRWTSAGGMVGLGDLPGGGYFSRVNYISPDGSVIVGRSESSAGIEAIRWTSAKGMVPLGDFPGGEYFSRAQWTSADGAVVVGWGTTAEGEQAFRWTQASGMVGLGDLPGGAFMSRAWTVSPSGDVVFGQGATEFGDPEAFRWTQAGGMEGLGGLETPPGVSYACATAAGVMAVGGAVSITSSPDFEAMAWTREAGMVGLGDLPGGAFSSSANDVSEDGRLVVGYSTSFDGQEAFIWDSTNGMRSLKGVLETQFGLDLAGWTLLEATGISDDGRFVVGEGINPAGDPEGWVATIPAPGSALVAVWMVWNVARRRR